jgi:hypothetical protein
MSWENSNQKEKPQLGKMDKLCEEFEHVYSLGATTLKPLSILGIHQNWLVCGRPVVMQHNAAILKSQIIGRF